MFTKKVFKLTTAIIIVAIIALSTLAAFAASVLEQLYVDYNAVTKIIIDGVEKTPPSDMRPFISNGRTYVSLRYIAEHFGKEINFDPKTGIIQINSEPLPVEDIKVEDTLTGPLSKNWNPGDSIGSWSVDERNGVWGRNPFAGFTSCLPFDSSKYSLSNIFTLEADVSAADSYGDGAGFYMNSNESSHDFPFRVFLNKNGVHTKAGAYGRKSAAMDLKVNTYYRLKVVVNEQDVDIYVDGKYIMSDTIPDNYNNGTEFGLFSSNNGNSATKSGSFIKNFKLTTGEETNND